MDGSMTVCMQVACGVLYANDNTKCILCTMSKVKTCPDLNMEYEEFGNPSAAPLLLIPPVGKTATAWARQLPLLSGAFRCIVPHLSRHGSAANDPEALDFRVLAIKIWELLDSLNVGNPHVAGWSTGTVIATELALTHPDRLASLSLYSPWLTTDTKLQATFQLLIDIAAFSPDMAAVETALNILQLSRREINAIGDLQRFVNSNIQEPHYPAVEDFIVYLKGCIQHDVSEDVDQITAPTLIIAGASDQFIDVSHSQEVANSIPGATYIELTDQVTPYGASIAESKEFNLIAFEFIEDLS